ncbi:MAG: hypothetical protein ACREI3_00030 [Nitrospirales bacterium]
MRLQAKGWASFVAIALVVGFASTALAIEAFQERFEWGDMSKPTKLQGRVIILDPYDEAVWLNVAYAGGNAESGYFWQKVHPGKNLKFYATKEAWAELKKLARPHAGPAAAKEVPPATEAALIEFVAQEVEQNHRVISSVKRLPEIAGEPGKTVSIAALKFGCKDETDPKCYKVKQDKATAVKAAPRMQYDVMLPGGQTIGGLIPWTAEYNEGK